MGWKDVYKRQESFLSFRIWYICINQSVNVAINVFNRIFRAGAMGLAEITAKGIPALLVPYPYAAENHQEHNARAMEQRGAARVVLDRALTAEKCIAFIEELAASEEKRRVMGEASRAMGRPEAAAEIAAMAIALAEGK